MCFPFLFAITTLQLSLSERKQNGAIAKAERKINEGKMMLEKRKTVFPLDVSRKKCIFAFGFTKIILKLKTNK